MLIEAFLLGNAAILTNVCLLPLYPGLMALLASRTDLGGRRAAVAGRLLGVAVLAGVVSFMVALGLLLYLVQRSVADLLGWLLPLAYAAVALLGVAMVLDRNPFARLAVAEAPLVRNPLVSAFLYGAFLAPMTLPCTGPLVVSAFVVGGVSGGAALASSLAYFAFFALGFGWPLVVLPLVAMPLQRRATRWLAVHHRQLGFASGVLLVAVAAFGLWSELRPAPIG